MKKLTPISLEGDSKEIFDAMCNLFVRASQMTRKRPSPIDLAIGPASIDVMVALEGYFNETSNLDETIKRLNGAFT